jgi:hypothetical protein
MARFVSLQLGNIVQNCGLNSTNPLQLVTWYAFNAETIDAAGRKSITYTQTSLQARIQPVSHDLIFKENLEFGNVYKRFYVLTDIVQTVDRNISTDGDFLYYNSLYWRVMRLPDEFLTTWQEIIAMQTNILVN